MTGIAGIDGVFEHVVSMFAPMSPDQIRQGAPQYSGGGGGHLRCCGTCEFYRIYDKHCLANEFRHPSGPNDPACNEYRWLR